jgi:hypothetical protein
MATDTPGKTDPEPSEAPMPAPGWAPEPKPIDPAKPGEDAPDPFRTAFANSRLASLATRDWSQRYSGAWGVINS